LNAQNLILPAGTTKIGATEYNVDLNGSPDSIAGPERYPVRTINGATTYLREVAHVRDGFLAQTNVVRQNGVRGGSGLGHEERRSTMQIVQELRAMLPVAAQALPRPT